MEELIIALIVIAVVVIFICVKFSSNSNKNAIAPRTNEQNNVGNKNQNQIQQNKQIQQEYPQKYESEIRELRKMTTELKQIRARHPKIIAELKQMNRNRKDNFLPDDYNQANVDEASQTEANQPELDEAAGPIYEKPAH